MAARFGGTVVLEPSFAYPHAVLARLIDERATGLPLVPTMVSMLLQMDLAKYNLSCLRYITTAGAALPAKHAERLRGLLPRVKIIPMYGQTECARVTYLTPEQLDRRPTSVGRGMPNQETAIVDEQGSRVGPGVVGELVVRGSHVMKGYWEMPEATRDKLRPGPIGDEPVLFTGDLFRADEEGYLYFVGRKDDIIKSRGEKVSPKEVEDVLCRHPDVAEAAVVGVPDKLLGEAIAAFVTLKPGVELIERELLRHCADHLEDFMVPQTIEIRDSLPKTDNGKIQKRALQGILS
jgi:acyl-coenzyme A synthetase/AMP-(fatty) acid ligase